MAESDRTTSNMVALGENLTGTLSKRDPRSANTPILATSSVAQKDRYPIAIWAVRSGRNPAFKKWYSDVQKLRGRIISFVCTHIASDGYVVPVGAP